MWLVVGCVALGGVIQQLCCSIGQSGPRKSPTRRGVVVCWGVSMCFHTVSQYINTLIVDSSLFINVLGCFADADCARISMVAGPLSSSTFTVSSCFGITVP